MTDRQEFQLVAPLIMGGAAFILFLILARITGDLNRFVWKALLACAGLISYALYLTVWQNEIKELWHFSPLIVVFALFLSLTIPVILFMSVWRVQVGARAERAEASSDVQSELAKPIPGAQKLARWVVLVWGLANLVGLLATVIHSYFFHER